MLQRIICVEPIEGNKIVREQGNKKTWNMETSQYLRRTREHNYTSWDSLYYTDYAGYARA